MPCVAMDNSGVLNVPVRSLADIVEAGPPPPRDASWQGAGGVPLVTTGHDRKLRRMEFSVGTVALI